MDARKIVRLAIFSSLVLGSTSIQNARAQPARAELPCDKDGPFAPRVDQDSVCRGWSFRLFYIFKRGR